MPSFVTRSRLPAQWLVQHRTTTIIHPIPITPTNSPSTFRSFEEIFLHRCLVQTYLTLLLDHSVELRRLRNHSTRANRPYFNPPLRSQAFVEPLELVPATSRSSYPPSSVCFYLSEHGRQFISPQAQQQRQASPVGRSSGWKGGLRMLLLSSSIVSLPFPPTCSRATPLTAACPVRHGCTISFSDTTLSLQMNEDRAPQKLLEWMSLTVRIVVSSITVRQQ